MVAGFICPVCKLPLSVADKSFFCPSGHHFDRAKSGYVNLAMDNRNAAKRHGDDKEMVRARIAFLDAGHYRLLQDTLIRESLPHLQNGGLFLDAGCGDGHYTALLADALAGDRRCTLCGIDLSKEALIAAGKRKKGLLLAVASAYHLPVADGSVALLWNIFSPCAGEEFARVLAPGGVLIRVFPLEEHLMGLKKLIYDHPYPNSPEEKALPGFSPAKTTLLRQTLVLDDPAQIWNLFTMTPYYYKTAAKDQEKLKQATRLETEIAFGFSVYTRETADKPAKGDLI